MDTKAAIFALLSVWGVGACMTGPATAEDVAIEDDESSEEPLLNKVWVLQNADSLRPGVMQIFLADGTLVSDSCWETYRLSRWQQVSETAISWEEDGATINADISSLTANELVLSLKLGSETVEQRFAAAEVPTVCPDVPKA